MALIPREAFPGLLGRTLVLWLDFLDSGSVFAEISFRTVEPGSPLARNAGCLAGRHCRAGRPDNGTGGIPPAINRLP